MARATGILEDLQGRLGDSITLTKRRNGTFTYPAHIRQPHNLSRKKLAVNEQQSHNNALWRALKQSNQVYFDGDKPAYQRFMSLNRESPIPYLKKSQYHSGNALLLPQMVLSQGPLTPIGYQLYEVDGQPALFTDLTKMSIRKGTILLYVLKQKVVHVDCDDDLFYLHITVETVTPEQFTNVPSSIDTPFKDIHGTLALVGERFADPMMGFGLVRVDNGRASSQRVVTRCSYYEKYTTEEAIQAAAKSYGGFTR